MVGPLIEVPVLVALVCVSLALRRRFRHHDTTRWRTGFVRYEPDGHSITVRLVAKATPQGDTAITDLVVAEAVAIVQQVASINHVYLELMVRSDNPITRHSG